MRRFEQRPSQEDLLSLLSETAEWMEAADHAHTQVEWRLKLLAEFLPPDDPDLLKMMRTRGRPN